MSRDRDPNLARIFEANPQFAPGAVPLPPPAPISAARVITAGGSFVELLMHPSITPMEFIFRKLPEDGMFNATPQRNFVFELGAVDVPQQMTFAMAWYRFTAHRLSGAAVGDTVPLEEGRLTSLMATDVTIDRTRKSNLNAEIDPTPIQSTADAYAPAPSAGIIAAGQGGTNTGTGLFALPQFAPSSGPSQATQAQFNIANFARAAVPSGVGKSGLPLGHARQGAETLPFTQYARSDQRMSFEITIFRPVPIPLAFFQCEVAGAFFPAGELDDIIRCMNPTLSPGGGR